MTFKDVMKKCFGKEKNDRWHAVAMLILYAIFFLISFIVISSWDTSTETNKNSTTPKEEKVEKKNVINYSYTYTVNYNDNIDVYTGKKYDKKEKFTLVQNGENSEYVVVNNKLYTMKNDNYELVNTFNKYYKYLNKDKILSLIDYNLCTKDNNTYTCDIGTKEIANSFNDTIISDSNEVNTIVIVKDNDEVKSIKLDLNNYINALLGESNTLTINMIYTDIGTTSDFDIKIK